MELIVKLEIKGKVIELTVEEFNMLANKVDSIRTQNPWTYPFYVEQPMWPTLPIVTC